MKVNFFDRRVLKIFLQCNSIFCTALSTALLFIEVPKDYRYHCIMLLLIFLFLTYVFIWIKSNRLNNIDIKIDGTNVSIKTGDIFCEPGFKSIAFNEYFDTQVDNKLINERSLNGIYLKEHLDIDIGDLNKKISMYDYEKDEILEKNELRAQGNIQKYRLGTIFVHNEYLLTAMSKFDDSNRATLTMPEYLEFLIRFWDRVNKVYAQKSVSTPIFGSGITRIKGHKNISDEDLLKIMLWTFRISEMRFKHPAKLSIIIHKDKIGQINLLDMALLSDGI